MRPVISALFAAVALLPASGFPQSRFSPEVLEALERYVARPTARIVSATEVARIDTDNADAVISAIIVEDPTQAPAEMRGIRIDLVSAELKDSVYASEQLFDPLIRALEGILRSAPASFAARSAPRRCRGAEMFWLQRGHAFSASQCIAPEWAGVQVGTGGGSEPYRFTGVDTAPFAAAITRARDILKR